MMTPWLALPSAFGLLLLLLALAFAGAAVEWGIWRLAARAGLPASQVGRLDEWIGGLGGLAHPGESRAESPAAGLGFALVAAGSAFPLGLLLLHPEAALLPVGMGVLALSPLVSSLGYAVAAERAPTPESARHRLAAASRILFAAPAWLAAVAVTAGWTQAGSTPANVVAHLLLALALLVSGLLVLPGAVAERSLTSRLWGGDASEPSGAVRFLTATAHYTSLCAVCLLAAWMTSAPGRLKPWAMALAVLGVLALRLSALSPRGGRWLLASPRWLVPALLVAYCARASLGRLGGSP